MTTIDEIKEAIKKDYVPNGIYSFNELDGFRTAQRKVQEAYSTIDDFMGLMYSIITSPEIVDKAGRIVALSRELEARITSDAPEEVTETREDSEKTEKSWSAVLKAMDGEKRLAYGVVLKPDVIDAQGDIMTQEDIEKAAHDFFINSRIMDLQHTEDLPSDRAVPVESYIAPQDMVVGGNKIAKGSWVMVTHIPDEVIWTQIKKGRIMAYSIRGLGKRTPIE